MKMTVETIASVFPIGSNRSKMGAKKDNRNQIMLYRQLFITLEIQIYFSQITKAVVLFQNLLGHASCSCCRLSELCFLSISLINGSSSLTMNGNVSANIYANNSDKNH